jgi:hypothetical protein
VLLVDQYCFRFTYHTSMAPKRVSRSRDKFGFVVAARSKSAPNSVPPQRGPTRNERAAYHPASKPRSLEMLENTGHLGFRAWVSLPKRTAQFIAAYLVQECDFEERRYWFNLIFQCPLRSVSMIHKEYHRQVCRAQKKIKMRMGSLSIAPRPIAIDANGKIHA